MHLSKSDVVLDRLLSLHPKIIDLTLDRVTRLLKKLNNPEDKISQVVHIAGTNGKGSTQAFLRAAIESSGESAHVYTSPHLTRFHERIRVAGSLISENVLADILNECELANNGKPITYFEITTCAAFLIFSRIKADYTLLEVGLGGRLDATNILKKPKLTIITPISMDHVQFLGSTIEQIANEKAGIIKEGIPCIVGHQSKDAIDVIKKRAIELKSKLKIYGEHWQVYAKSDKLIFKDAMGFLELPLPKLIGQHQIENAGTAIAAMRELSIPDEACKESMKNVYWPARMQRLESGPLVKMANESEIWLDGGHNQAAGIAISNALEQLPKGRTNILICGMLKTKDLKAFLNPLFNSAKFLYGIRIQGEENSNSAETIVNQAREIGFSAFKTQKVSDAILQIIKAHPNSRIIICGSLFLAGKILQDNA
jgi:dihydrofolate synthase / folylpolyglutamate synthase|tara:strand:+ start:685 stop:1962 length:1278 start_codon:yes stop_codon:yes gene_type:complete